MNEVKIIELNELESANVSNTDVLPIVDVSANETKKIKVQNIKTVVNNEYSTSTTETYSANYINNLPSGEGGGIIALKSITTAPSTFSEGDKYYNANDDLIYTATSSSTWDEGTTASAVSLYLNEIDNELYRYYNNTMNLLESGSGGGGNVEVGTIFQYPGTTAPTNYMICDGSAISRTTYADLFAVIGTTYGSGDGSTTFNIPDMRKRVPVGLDSNDTDFDTLGETGGEKTHKHLTSFGMDNGTIYSALDNSNNPLYGSEVISVNRTSGYISAPGSGAARIGYTNNSSSLQPYIVLNYIIKVVKTTPVQGEVVNTYSTSTEDAYSCDYVNDNFQMNGTVLYNDATGSNTNLTLSDSVGNYSYLEIYFRTNDNYRDSVKVISSSSSFDVVLQSTNWMDSACWLKGRVVTIDGTSINTRTSGTTLFYGEINVTNSAMSNANNIYITRVIGYN